MSNIHTARWSWLGPETEVNDATRVLASGLTRYSQIDAEPQSWAMTCTGWVGLITSMTAAKSSASRATVYSRYDFGDDDGPTPRLSYLITRNVAWRRSTCGDHMSSVVPSELLRKRGGPSSGPSIR